MSNPIKKVQIILSQFTNLEGLKCIGSTILECCLSGLNFKATYPTPYANTHVYYMYFSGLSVLYEIF